jgi:hypothetical protein
LIRRWRDRATGRISSNLLDFLDGRPLAPGPLARFIAWGWLAAPDCLLAGVERLPAGPWRLPAPDPLPSALPDPDARADRLWDLLLAAVRRSAAGAARPRATLSGGLDSRAVAAAARAAGLPGLSLGTFGDADCPDHPLASKLARALGLPHEATVLPADGALVHEERVWRASGGSGGPASAPGAPTDGPWASSCDRLLSGMSGDVIWGETGLPGPAPPRRLRALGLAPGAAVLLPAPALASLPPAWASPAGGRAWRNLHTRQQGTTWDGVLPRLEFTPVVPVAWDPPLLSFCLALPGADRKDRALLRRMLRRHAPEVSEEAVPRADSGPVHDLDRAFREVPGWRAELDDWLAPSAPSLRAWSYVGLRWSTARALLDDLRSARSPRPRAAFLSRLRAAWRWGLLES